jgi:hypothetical protein
MSDESSEPNNRVSSARPGDEWHDAMGVVATGTSLGSKRRGHFRNDCRVKVGLQIGQRVHLDSAVPLTPEVDRGEPVLNIREIGGAVIRLEFEVSEPREFPRFALQEADSESAQSYRPRGHARRKQALRRRWMVGGIGTVLLVAAVVALKIMQAQGGDLPIGTDFRETFAQPERAVVDSGGAAIHSEASHGEMPSLVLTQRDR